MKHRRKAVCWTDCIFSSTEGVEDSFGLKGSKKACNTKRSVASEYICHLKRRPLEVQSGTAGWDEHTELPPLIC